MKLIEPSVELIEQESGLEGIYKQIERAGRICYKSEDKIVDCIKIDMKDVPENADENFWKDMPNYKENPKETIKWLNKKNIKYDFIKSANKFVNMLIEKKHYAMLEHGTVYLKFEDLANNDVVRYIDNPYSAVGKNLCVTSNLRVLQENNWLDDLKYICEPTKYHEKRYTLKFTTSIGITREIIRHRHMSFANESTRYCNYSKKGNDGVVFVIPSFLMGVVPAGNNEIIQKEYDNIKNQTVKNFILQLRKADFFYELMIKNGYKPQEAREVLPMCTKSEIIVTGFKNDWDAFFKLRCDKAAHPDMQYLANKAKEFFPAHTY